jgi:hypothetical protein
MRMRLYPFITLHLSLTSFQQRALYDETRKVALQGMIQNLIMHH